MNDHELVENIIKYSGGKENIRNVTNCMTRLRFEIKNEQVFDIEKIKSIEGVLSVVADRKNYPEIVLGPGRCRKCADICREQGLYSLNDKNIEMLHVKDITNVTGYVRGGCTSIGMKKQFVTRVEESAMLLDYMYVSAGKIGAQLKLKPDDLLKANGGEYADIIK